MSKSSLSENAGEQPSWVLGENFPVTSSYLAPGMFQQNDRGDRTKIKKLASKILRDPLLLRKLSDRVYELMLEDINRQKERSNNYRRLY